MVYQAVTVDSALMADPGFPVTGTVHSAFHSVINVMRPDGELWCLTSREIPAGPRAVTVDIAAYDDWHVTPGTPVIVDGPIISVGGRHTVTLDGVHGWQARAVTGTIDAARCARFAELVARHGVAGGALPGKGPFAQAVASGIRSALDALAAAVRDTDAEAAASAAGRLVGLGPGLTPAGDDVLTGLAFTAHCLGGALAIIPAAVRATATAGATNDLSRTALLDACAGRVGAPLTDALAALTITGTRPDIEEAVTRLVAVGHTSGTDQACGLLEAARLAQGCEELPCPPGR